MTALPEKIEPTHFGWDEERWCYRIQLGTNEGTVAYVWTPRRSKTEPDADVTARASATARRLCDGWNAGEAGQ